jgi:hypothetical protein
MNAPVAGDPVLVRFRSAVAQAYGDRLDRAVLFGSRARGDFRPDSDCDIAAFIRTMGDWADEVMTLAAIGTATLMDAGAVISAQPFPANGCDGALLREIRR